MNLSSAQLQATTSADFIERYIAEHNSSKRTAERHINQKFGSPEILDITTLKDENNNRLKKLVASQLYNNYRRKRWLSLFLQLVTTDSKTYLVANDARQGRRWLTLEPHQITLLNEADDVSAFINQFTEILIAFSRSADKNIVIWPHLSTTLWCRRFVRATSHSSAMPLISDIDHKIYLPLAAYQA